MKKEDLKVDTIYRLKKGLEDLNVCVLKSNRNNPVKNKKMLEGLQKIEMQQPGIFADAKLAMEAGYTLLDVTDNHEIIQEEVDEYLVIVDGNTRFHAFQLAAKQDKHFDYIFQYKRYADAESFRQAYQQMNVYNTPTSAADFARDIEATSKSPVLVSYRSRIDDGLFPKSAGYSVIGREITKKDMTEVQKGEIPSLFNDEVNRELFERIYTGIKDIRNGSPAMFRGTEIWSWNASKINGATDKDEMANKLITLFMEMPPLTLLSLQNAKKKGNKTKETVVKDILDEAFTKMKVRN